MNIVEAQLAVKKERERLKKLKASKELLYRLERVASDLGTVINCIKREGFDPEEGV